MTTPDIELPPPDAWAHDTIDSFVTAERYAKKRDEFSFFNREFWGREKVLQAIMDDRAAQANIQGATE